MGWAKFDDAYSDHPKVVAAGPMAELLDVRAIMFCARYDTDGRIPAAQLARLSIGIPNAKRHAQRLVEVGRWETSADGDGWVVHDYLAYNPSRAERQMDREVARRRSAMNANPELSKFVKARDRNTCRYCATPVNWRDRKSPTGGTYDHVIPVSLGGDEHPDNIVTACRSCNLRKGPRTPEQAGMTLVPVPEINQISSTHLDGTKQEPRQPDPSPAPTPKPRKHKRPADFAPSQAHRDYAAEHGLNLDAEFAQFCDNHDAKGNTFVDWSKALSTWLRQAVQFGRGRVAPVTPLHRDSFADLDPEDPSNWSRASLLGGQ